MRQNRKKRARCRAFSHLLSIALMLLSASAGAAGSAGPVCGEPGRPPCPLQRWMRTERAQPIAKKDAGALADALERLSALNPEPNKWQNWTKFAQDGARAAREGKTAAVTIACAHCHSIYRGEYNIKYRRRAIR